MDLPEKVIGCTSEEWALLKELAANDRATNFVKKVSKWDWDEISSSEFPTVVLADGDFVKLRNSKKVIDGESLRKICSKVHKVI